MNTVNSAVKQLVFNLSKRNYHYNVIGTAYATTISHSVNVQTLAQQKLPKKPTFYYSFDLAYGEKDQIVNLANQINTKQYQRDFLQEEQFRRGSFLDFSS